MRPEESSRELAPNVASGDRDGGVPDEDGFGRISVLAVVSMGLPFLSLLLFMIGVSFHGWTLYLPPVALLLGIVALVGINRSDGRLGGRGFAIVGIVLGLGGTLAIAVSALLALSDMMCGYEGTC